MNAVNAAVCVLAVASIGHRAISLLIHISSSLDWPPRGIHPSGGHRPAPPEVFFYSFNERRTRKWRARSFGGRNGEKGY